MFAILLLVSLVAVYSTPDTCNACKAFVNGLDAYIKSHEQVIISYVTKQCTEPSCRAFVTDGIKLIEEALGDSSHVCTELEACHAAPVLLG